MTGSSMRSGQILFFSFCLVTIMFSECHSYPTDYEDDLEGTTQNDNIAHISMEQEDFKRGIPNIYLGSVCEIAESPVVYDCLHSPCTSKAKTITVPFKTFYARIPQVMVAIAYLDVDNSANTRVSAEVKQVKKNEFTVEIKSWSQSKLYQAKVNWIACGPPRPTTLSVKAEAAQ